MAKRRKATRKVAPPNARSKPRTRKVAAPARPRGAAARRAARAAVRPIIELNRVWDTIRQRLPAEFRVQVRRPDDLLVFDLLFDNMKIEAGASPRLVRKNPNASATLIVEFQPQSFGEQAFLAVSETDPDSSSPEEKEVSENTNYPPKNVAAAPETIPPLPSARVRISGRSRLAFLMPAGEAGTGLHARRCAARDADLADAARRRRRARAGSPRGGRRLGLQPRLAESRHPLCELDEHDRARLVRVGRERSAQYRRGHQGRGRSTRRPIGSWPGFGQAD